MSNALLNLTTVLDGPNYQIWTRQMSAYLQSVELWLVTDGTYTEPVAADPQNPTDAETEAINKWNNTNLKALGTITLRLSPAIADATLVILNAHTLWTHLEAQYGRVSPARVFELYKKTHTF